MDLSAPLFDGTAIRGGAADLAVLLAGVVARQAASQTAAVQTRIAAACPDDALLAPRHGAFNVRVASLLGVAGTAMNAPFTERLQPIFNRADHRSASTQPGAFSPDRGHE